MAFSFNGAYLATADLNGKIQVWKTSDFSLTSTFELEDELSVSKKIKTGKKLYLINFFFLLNKISVDRMAPRSKCTCGRLPTWYGIHVQSSIRRQ